MVLSIVLRNTLRHKLRTALTILCIALVLAGFGFIRTVITAWYAGVEAASADRLVTRNSVSVIFTLPTSYRDQLLKFDGVKKVTYANWFGGVYINPDNFFMQFAVDKDTYFEVFPELIVPPDQMAAYLKDRQGVIVGRKLADRFGWKLGDRVTLIGTIFAGDWDFNIDGIYTGKDPNVDESIFLMRWDYLDEWVKKNWPGYPSEVGWFGLKLSNPERASEISAAVDQHFKNSSAETLTETEKAYQMSFVSMSGTILVLLQVVSALIIGIILLVLINTMAMTARERISEYAYMKSMGFQAYHLAGLIIGESLVISCVGGLFGFVLLLPITHLVAATVSQWFPIFNLSATTIALLVITTIGVGIIASIFPIQKVLRMKIVDGLRVVE